MKQSREEGIEVKLVGSASVPEKGRHHVLSPACTFPPLLMQQSQLPGPQLGIQLNTDARPCSAVELGGQDLSTQT